MIVCIDTQDEHLFLVVEAGGDQVDDTAAVGRAVTGIEGDCCEDKRLEPGRLSLDQIRSLN